MKKPRLSLKTLVWVLAFSAVLLGWWRDHQRLAQMITEWEAIPPAWRHRVIPDWAY
jgi:hypothetical protein